MASTVSSSLVLFVTFNLLFFSLVTASPILGGSGGSSGGSGGATCPRDALKLGICAKLLGGLLGVTVGTPPVQPCCSLIAGLVDLEAAACLCTAIRANVLGINLNVPVSLSLLLSACGKRVPRGFQCA